MLKMIYQIPRYLRPLFWFQFVNLRLHNHLLRGQEYPGHPAAGVSTVCPVAGVAGDWEEDKGEDQRKNQQRSHRLFWYANYWYIRGIMNEMFNKQSTNIM